MVQKLAKEIKEAETDLRYWNNTTAKKQFELDLKEVA